MLLTALHFSPLVPVKEELNEHDNDSSSIIASGSESSKQSEALYSPLIEVSRASSPLIREYKSKGVQVSDEDIKRETACACDTFSASKLHRPLARNPMLLQMCEAYIQLYGSAPSYSPSSLPKAPEAAPEAAPKPPPLFSIVKHSSDSTETNSNSSDPVGSLINELTNAPRVKMHIQFDNPSSKERRNVDKFIVRSVLRKFEGIPKHKLGAYLGADANSATVARVTTFLSAARTIEQTQNANKHKDEAEEVQKSGDSSEEVPKVKYSKANKLYSKMINLMMRDQALLALLHDTINSKLKELEEGSKKRISDKNLTMYKGVLRDYKKYIDCSLKP